MDLQVDDGCTADEVYRATYDRVAARSEKFYLKYPQHVATVREIVELLDKEPQRLPGGGVLTVSSYGG